MPFKTRNLSVLAYTDGFTLWHYKAGADTKADVARQDFFSGAGDMLTRGDLIVVSAADGGRMMCVLDAGARPRIAPM